MAAEQRDSVLFLLDTSSVFEQPLSTLAAVCQTIVERQRVQRNTDFGVVFSAFSGNTNAQIKLTVSNPTINELEQLLKLCALNKLDCASGSRNGLVTGLECVDTEFGRIKRASLCRLVIITASDNIRISIDTVSSLFERIEQKHSALVLPLFLGPSFDTDLFWKFMPFFQPSEHESCPTTNLAADLSLNFVPINLNLISQHEYTQIVCSKASRKIPAYKAFVLLGNIAVHVNFYRIVKERRHSYDRKQVNETTEPDSSVPLSKEQVNLVSAFPDLHALVINRFLPFASVTRFPRFGNAYFVVPSTRVSPNSKIAFESLHRVMCKQQVVACTTLYARKAPVRGYLYAYHPLANQIEPSTLSGMYFVPIACIDEQRSSPNNATMLCAEPAVNNLVTKLEIKKFSPSLFIDPKTTQWTSAFEQTALTGRAFSRETEDLTVPNYTGLNVLNPECSVIKASK